MIEQDDRPVAAEPPRQPTRAQNCKIRDWLDDKFDDQKGRWFGDWSDQKVAEALRFPRAWVTAIREFYGDDTNEAAEQTNAVAEELRRRAAEIEATALDLATRAETLGRDVGKFLNGRAL